MRCPISSWGLGTLNPQSGMGCYAVNGQAASVISYQPDDQLPPEDTLYVGPERRFLNLTYDALLAVRDVQWATLSFGAFGGFLCGDVDPMDRAFPPGDEDVDVNDLATLLAVIGT